MRRWKTSGELSFVCCLKCGADADDQTHGTDWSKCAGLLLSKNQSAFAHRCAGFIKATCSFSMSESGS